MDKLQDVTLIGSAVWNAAKWTVIGCNIIGSANGDAKSKPRRLGAHEAKWKPLMANRDEHGKC